MESEREDHRIHLSKEQLDEAFHADSRHEMFFDENIVTIDEELLGEMGQIESWQNSSLIDDLESINSPQETLDK